jgi:hypothetical protein
MARDIVQYPTPRLPTAHGTRYTLAAHDDGNLEARAVIHGG